MYFLLAIVTFSLCILMLLGDVSFFGTSTPVLTYSLSSGKQNFGSFKREFSRID